jgi:hypothetical protein
LIAAIPTTARNRDIANRCFAVKGIYACYTISSMNGSLCGGNSPARLEVTSKAIPEIGTLPIAVFAVTSAVPLNPRSAEFLSVTCANMASNAPLLTEVNGTLWKLIGKAARFPVDTPPTLLDWGRFNCTKDQSLFAWAKNKRYLSGGCTSIAEVHVDSGLNHL